jgi:hypothetical protein
MTGPPPDQPDEVEAAIDLLYELAPEDFVAGRDELARRLRLSGDRDAARDVKSLRKPSPAAWAVNQLARRGLLTTLLDISAELRAAQGGASGAGPEALRELSAKRRREVASLTEQAGKILRESGSTAARAQLDRVSNTLQALTLDEEGAERLGGGRLERDETPTGFGGSFPAAGPSLAESKHMEDRDQARRREELRRVAEEADREAERLAQKARAAEDEAARARAAADAAAGRAAEARRAVEGAG